MRAYFNPRSREGSDLVATCSAAGVGNFNPRSREGSDFIRYGKIVRNGISIHAPVKGATVRQNLANETTQLISIHAPVKGATRYAQSHYRR